MAERGYYSLIQFMPNPGRSEGANVGVVLVCPRLRSVHVALSEDNEAPKRLFRAASFDDARLSIAKDAIAGRLKRDLADHPTLEGLQRARALEANSLTLTEPRSVAVFDNPEEIAESLNKELVYIEASHRDRARTPDISPLITYLEKRDVPIGRPGQVVVPVTEEPLKVAFSYVNGAQHYVHAQGFSQGKKLALEQAKNVGAQGRLLHYHSANEPLRKKLIVFAGMADPAHASMLRKLLEGMNVRLVDSAKGDDFAKEVERTAHKPVPGANG